jgi:hypothetical protein
MIRARTRFGSAAVDNALAAFQRGGDSAVFADPQHAGIARAIIYCLYTGFLPDSEGAELEAKKHYRTEDPTDYFEAVLWRVIQAHPPALSGAYFGHWHYPPEDAHDGS